MPYFDQIIAVRTIRVRRQAVACFPMTRNGRFGVRSKNKILSAVLLLDSDRCARLVDTSKREEELRDDVHIVGIFFLYLIDLCPSTVFSI